MSHAAPKALLTIAGLALIATVTGCAPTSHALAATPVPTVATPVAEPVEASPPATATPSATPTPTATTHPPADPDILFTVTARASGSNGAKADILMRVYTPTATASDADKAALNTQCDGWKTTYPSHKYLTATVTSTLEPGSTAWSNSKDWVGVDLDGYPAWSGRYGTFEASCATAVLKIAGSVHGVTPAPASNSADGKLGWARGRYGFAIAEDGGSSKPPKPGQLTIDHCAITLSARAATSTIASHWPTQAQKLPGIGCEWGEGF